MSPLPYMQSDNSVLNQLQTKWKSLLDPLLGDPLSKGVLLTNVALINGVTVVNHLLGRNQQGWVITDIQASATIYRSAPLNDKTLTLTSNSATTVSLLVF